MKAFNLNIWLCAPVGLMNERHFHLNISIHLLFNVRIHSRCLPIYIQDHEKCEYAQAERTHTPIPITMLKLYTELLPIQSYFQSNLLTLLTKLHYVLQISLNVEPTQLRVL